MVPLIIASLGLAAAYETDQLTDREVPLADAAALVDARLDDLLDQAIARVNAKTRCTADTDRTRHVLARQIEKLTSKPRWVMERGLLRAPGFSRYSAWVERNPDIEKRSWTERDDLYADITLWQSLILTTAGPSSTIRVGDVLVGTDKFDHFLDFGYLGWKRSRHGAHPERVDRFNTRTERRFFGMISSKTYSFGDIAANSDGFRWFAALLTPDSDIQRDEDGCVVRVAPFRWEDEVDWRYDEALNPPLYTRPVQKRVTRRIAREPDRYCRAWEALGGPEYDQHLAAVIAEDAALPRRYDGRFDPFDLAALCATPADAPDAPPPPDPEGSASPAPPPGPR